MDNNASSNDDEEPKICTVFASSATSGSTKTVFDTIAFSMPKKEALSTSASVTNMSDEMSHQDGSETSTSGLFIVAPPATQQQESNTERSPDIFSGAEDPSTHSLILPTISSDNVETKQVSQVEPEGAQVVDIFEEAAATVVDQVPFMEENIVDRMTSLVIQEGSPQVQVGQGDEVDPESPIPTANKLFADTPEVPFPIGQFTQSDSDPSTFFNQLSTPVPPPPSSVHQAPTTFKNLPFSTNAVPTQDALSDASIQQPEVEEPQPAQQIQQSIFSSPRKQPLVLGSVAPSTYNSTNYTPLDTMHDAWIPKEETKKILMALATAERSARSYLPDKLHITTPGIIYEDDLIDKVGVNMARIFGEGEASKRRILTADSVTQDDNGLRELIKLGCYRSAINLTKRLLTLYGQGLGKVGQFSKHNPHTLQLWFTRISLLIRIREFTIAESEIDAFKEFDNPDLYYEYYPDLFGKDRKGSMVPFNFRVLSAEILQYSKKHNETIDRLTRILHTVQEVNRNLENGSTEDGSAMYDNEDNKVQSLDLWRTREIRVYYSLANASLFAKDYYNALKYLTILCEKDKAKEAQLRSAICRFFLQLGDLTTASTYFQAAADLRQGDSDSEQAENLVDSAMITIAHGSYPEAFALLQQALPIQPDNFMITNNMAVCLLYMGKVKESLALMETTVKNNTPQLLQENVLLNLSTIYELENTDGHKKNALLKLISEYKGDGINLASLKMPNLI